MPVSATRPEIFEQTEGPLGRYRGRDVQPASLRDSPRLDTLMRGGILYLTLRDAIALSVENNLDIELQRLTPMVAEADILRARAGGIARGVPLNVREGPSGLGAGGAGTQGVGGGQGVSTTPGQTADQSFSATAASTVPVISPQNTASGPNVPLFDPAIVGTIGYTRNNRPQTNTFITGTNALISKSTLGDLRLVKGFGFGGNASLGFDNSRVQSNNARNDVNPSTTGGLALNYVQPLLRGFGRAVNNRYIRIAQNNRRVSDLAFEQQVVSTVFAVTRLYWDLVGLAGEQRVQQQTLELAERLQRENSIQEEAGTLAPIDVVRARAEVARARRDLTIAETRLRQQETILKDYITRGTVDEQRLATLRVVATDAATPPTQEPIQPLQDLIGLAQKFRPDVAQAAVQLDNSKITLTGSKSGLRPALDLVVSGRSNSLYGQVSTLPQVGAPGGIPIVRDPDPGFIGGPGTGFDQIFTGRFPDYSVQLQLNIPLLNRAAQADYARDQISVRQQEIRLRQLDKQVRVDVVNALIAVEQTRAAWEASQQARVFQEQSLDAEREKYSVGASTNYLVIQYQRDLAMAQSAEVLALNDYMKARTALDRATGTLLERSGISIAEAYKGNAPN